MSEVFLFPRWVTLNKMTPFPGHKQGVHTRAFRQPGPPQTAEPSFLGELYVFGGAGEQLRCRVSGHPGAPPREQMTLINVDLVS